MVVTRVVIMTICCILFSSGENLNKNKSRPQNITDIMAILSIILVKMFGIVWYKIDVMNNREKQDA